MKGPYQAWKYLRKLLFAAFLALACQVAAPLQAATITIGATSTTPYSFTQSGSPMSSVTINAGDSVVWDSTLNSAGHSLYITDPGGCFQNLYLTDNSFPVTHIFFIPGSYKFYGPNYVTCPYNCWSGNCTGFIATLVVNAPVTITNPPCNWAVTTA